MTRREMTALKSAEIEKFVARPDATRPVVLIFGADAGLVRERAEKIIKASVDNLDDPFSLVRLEGDDLSGDAGRLVDEANTIPLFGGRGAVWVKAVGATLHRRWKPCSPRRRRIAASSSRPAICAAARRCAICANAPRVRWRSNVIS